jgi:hypothetical protein
MARPAPDAPGPLRAEERRLHRSQAGPSAIIVMVASDEQAARVSRDAGDIGGYLGGLPSSFVVVESAREAEIVRVLLKNDTARLLIDFSQR